MNNFACPKILGVRVPIPLKQRTLWKMVDPDVWTSVVDVVTSDTTTNSDDRNNNGNSIDVMMLLSTIVASIGIVSNATVIIAFLNHKKLRSKIPTMFIINQVSFLAFCSLIPLSVYDKNTIETFYVF